MQGPDCKAQIKNPILGSPSYTAMQQNKHCLGSRAGVILMELLVISLIFHSQNQFLCSQMALGPAGAHGSRPRPQVPGAQSPGPRTQGPRPRVQAPRPRSQGPRAQDPGPSSAQMMRPRLRSPDYEALITRPRLQGPDYEAKITRPRLRSQDYDDQIAKPSLRS